ncbi:hypothetical protein [Fulvimarina manganoxydans]|nr:hypothetical protein [Fulvimarina manganoxydans]
MTSATKTYIDRMVAWESAGWGDQKNAVERLARRHQIPFWSLEHARTRAKTIKDDFAAMVRSAYLKECERQIECLRHELEMERAKGAGDDFADLEREAEALVAKLVEARKAALRRAGR